VIFVGGHHENVAGSSSERRHFGSERCEVQRLENSHEVRDEVGAVLTAQRGLQYESSVTATLVTAGGQNRDLVALRRKRFGILGYFRHLLLQLLQPFDHLSQKRSLVRLNKIINSKAVSLFFKVSLRCNKI